MSLFNLFTNNSKSPGKPANPPVQPTAPKPAPEKSFFGSKNSLNRMELREKLRRESGKIPGSRTFFSKDQRAGLEKDVFGKKFGEYISPVEFREVLKQLGKQKFAAKTSKEKLEIDRKIRFLKKLSGEK